VCVIKVGFHLLFRQLSNAKAVARGVEDQRRGVEHEKAGRPGSVAVNARGIIRRVGKLRTLGTPASSKASTFEQQA
jgi:hypothetical protein